MHSGRGGVVQVTHRKDGGHHGGTSVLCCLCDLLSPGLGLRGQRPHLILGTLWGPRVRAEVAGRGIRKPGLHRRGVARAPAQQSPGQQAPAGRGGSSSNCRAEMSAAATFGGTQGFATELPTGPTGRASAGRSWPPSGSQNRLAARPLGGSSLPRDLHFQMGETQKRPSYLLSDLAESVFTLLEITLSSEPLVWQRPKNRPELLVTYTLPQLTATFPDFQLETGAQDRRGAETPMWGR